jgi:microcystin-dependent protein
MATPFVSEIRMFGGNFAPSGFALCNGQLMSISQNTALFSLLGTNFGGNGTSTFGLPNLQGRFPMSLGQGPGLSDRVIGETAGVESVILTTTTIPAHSHAALGGSAGGTTDDPTGSIWAMPHQGKAGISAYTASAPTTAMNAQALQPTGLGLPHNNIPPYLVVNFIIALRGIFPARN